MNDRLPSTCLLWIVLSLFAAGLLLASCGQKGDLYLPEKPQEEVDPS